MRGKEKKISFCYLFICVFFLQLIEGLKSWDSIRDMYILRFMFQTISLLGKMIKIFDSVCVHQFPSEIH